LSVENDERYRFTEANQAFCKIIGLNQSQVIGKMVNEFIVEPTLTRVLGKYKEAIMNGHLVRFEYERTGHWMVTYLHPILGDDGLVNRMAVYSHDVTELKRMKGLME